EWNFDADTASGDTLVLYAKWTPVQGGPPEPIPESTTVTFVTGCSAVVLPQVINVGSKVQQPNVTNEGYTLDGWYNGSTKWNFDTDTVSGKTLTLTAKWTKNTIDVPIIGDGDDVTVTFNVGLDARKAGTYSPAAVTVKAGSTITEPQLSRSGYEVSGWYVEEGTKKWDFAKDKVTENVTLFAKWQAGGGTAIEYTPTMQDNNTLYIHYLRSAGDYDGWYIYNWNGNNNQEIKNTVAKDASGAVFAINLKDSINNGLATINIIVTQANWNKDGDDDIHVVLTNAQKVGNSYHWYITQGNTANGSNKAMAVSSGGGSANRQTEKKRPSEGNVNRAYAQSLPVMKTVNGWDEIG
ncbi:MAG: InlB B-repeat-containing protein, partial [Clostridiales bacterium]|nr:InlB B-repeat-containing protein [Clostridiales bacterium]